MESDNDPQVHALEISPEKAPAQTARKRPGNSMEKIGEEDPATDSPRQPLFRRLLEACGRPLRQLKQVLLAGSLRIIDAGSGILQRLRKRTETPHDEDEDRKDDRHRDSGENRFASKKAAPLPTTEAIKAVEPRRPIRSFFITLLVLIIGGIAGMTFSFALLSKIITNQAERIGDQRDEIAQMENQLSRILQSEAKYRLESMAHQKKLSEIENHLNPAIQNPVVQNPAIQNPAIQNQNRALQNPVGKNPPPTESKGNPTTPVTEKPPLSNKSGNCTLESGNVGDNLARCISEFNRK